MVPAILQPVSVCGPSDTTASVVNVCGPSDTTASVVNVCGPSDTTAIVAGVSSPASEPPTVLRWFGLRQSQARAALGDPH